MKDRRKQRAAQRAADLVASRMVEKMPLENRDPDVHKAIAEAYLKGKRNGEALGRAVMRGRARFTP